MRRTKITTQLMLIVLVCVMACLIYSPMVSGWEGEDTVPADYLERLARGESLGWLPPSIDELTQGKVKVGDLVTKENVDAVKDLVPLWVYEAVKGGMVLRMAKNVPPEKTAAQFVYQATAKNKGKAILDKEQKGTVYTLEEGTPWVGGVPFPEPKTPLEAMANAKIYVFDDDYAPTSALTFLSNDGTVEKTSSMRVWEMSMYGRLTAPPLGTVPGYENVQRKSLQVFVEPLEMKGLGQLQTRYYDEYANPDEGFLYIPSFKRVIRVSATTYQDNMGGSDVTWGDPSGLYEPFAYWKFTSMSKKLMLLPEPDNPLDSFMEGKVWSNELEFDVGKKYPRMGWVVAPTTIVEGVPQTKHIYSKKVFYLSTMPCWVSGFPIQTVDIYDRQGKLWKGYINYRNAVTSNGITYPYMPQGFAMFDMQTGHATVNFMDMTPNNGLKAEQFSLTFLLKHGR